MEKEINKFYSESLREDMEVVTYGRYGITMIMFPANSDSSHEPEQIGFIESLKDYLNSGRLKLYCVSTVNSQSWYNTSISDEQKSYKLFEYNKFIEDELVPHIYETCGGPVPIMTVGASVGGYHAANTFFRRPDIIMGTVAISAFYDIRRLTKGYFDENCYYNSPMDYLPNLTDSYWISYLMSRRHIYLISGSGSGETPHETEIFSRILEQKSIRHKFDLWDEKYGSEPCSWNEMMKSIMNSFL